ncbi:MAG: hypothetical protein ABJB98_08280 [Actinomycetota bacterium]
MRATRALLGLAGLLMIGYGGWRILDNRAATQPVKVGEWLIGALILHDGILSFVIFGLGWLLARTIPGRARAYVQGGLIAGGLVTAVAVLLIYRRGKSQPGQALLTQNYGANLAILLALIAAGTALAYALRVARDSRHPAGVASNANVRPDADQTSSM